MIKIKEIKINQKITIIIFIFIIALLLRLFASIQMPLTYDEQQKIHLAENLNVSFSPASLPLGNKEIPHSLLSVYLAKLGFLLFNKSLVSGRNFFVILGTLSLFFIFFLVKNELGWKAGFFSLCLLSFEQFHIGECAQIREEGPLLLFSSLSIYLFFKYFKTNRVRYLYGTALALGFGYLCKEIILLIAFTMIMFLALNKKTKPRLKTKEALIALILIILPILPYLFWGLRNNFSNYQNQNYTIGLSLRFFYLYFGEIIVFLSKHTHIFLLNLQEETLFFRGLNGNNIFISVLSTEFPLVHWLTGILIFTSVFFSLRPTHRTEPIIQFSLILFFLVMIMTTFIDPSLFDSHWRASLSLYPGIIMTANMLDLTSKNNLFIKYLYLFTVFYLLIHSFYFVFTVNPNINYFL